MQLCFFFFYIYIYPAHFWCWDCVKFWLPPNEARLPASWGDTLRSPRPRIKRTFSIWRSAQPLSSPCACQCARHYSPTCRFAMRVCNLPSQSVYWHQWRAMRSEPGRTRLLVQSTFQTIHNKPSSEQRQTFKTSRLWNCRINVSTGYGTNVTSGFLRQKHRRRRRRLTSSLSCVSRHRTASDTRSTL